MARARSKAPPAVADPPARACAACGSQARRELHVEQVDYAGIEPGTAREYQQVLRRRVQCAECGQVWIETVYE